MGAPLLKTYQQRVADALKAQGLVPLSTGVTNPIAWANDYTSAMQHTTAAVDKTQATFGARTLDRYSDTVGSSYRDQRYNLIKGFENVRLRSYQDTTGPAIGLGFNFNRPNARQVWDQAIGKSVSFDAAKAGKVSITSGQARALFDHDILYAESVVSKAAGNRPLTTNQRLALVSVAYSAPARVAGWADTLQNGTNAQVMDLILHDSYAPNNPYADALKSRRYSEATLFGNPAEAKAIMPSFQSYRDNVQVDTKSGKTTIRTFGTADVQHLDPEFAGRIQNLISAAPPNIQSGLGVFSGYRSPAHQAELYAQALKKYGSPEIARKWVAAPPSATNWGSNHNHGMAADLAYNGHQLSIKGGAPKEVIDWVHANAPKYGLAFHLDNEAWHVEPVELTRRGHGPTTPNGKLASLSGLAPIPNARTTLAAPTPMSRDNVDGLRAAAVKPKATIFDNPNDPLLVAFNSHFGTPPLPRPRPETSSGYKTPPDAYYEDRAASLRAAVGEGDYVTPPDAYDPAQIDGTVPKAVIHLSDAKARYTTPPDAYEGDGRLGLRDGQVPEWDQGVEPEDTRPSWVIAAAMRGRPSVIPRGFGPATLTDVPRAVVNYGGPAIRPVDPTTGTTTPYQDYGHGNNYSANPTTNPGYGTAMASITAGW